MGKAHFDKFHNAQCWIQRKEYEHGADELLNSEWAKQVGKRAIDLVKQFRTGEWLQ